MDRELRIIFMGTPAFAVASLDAIVKGGFDVRAVVTAPDKPSGRGRHLRFSAVKEYALQHQIPVLQPINLKDPVFVEELRSLNANLQVVVAFRMLPEVVWNMPEYGSFNLHASLLPKYRGAAPINWAIINGEEETGLTTFFLKHEIDTGNILYQEKIIIDPADTAGSLHDKMALAGGKLVIKSLDTISKGDVNLIEQDSMGMDQESLPKAPKIFKADCIIDWNRSASEIHNRIRGLSPAPGAVSTLKSPENISFAVKLYSSAIEKRDTDKRAGTILTDSKSHISVCVKDGFINIHELQLEGKKRMKAEEFLRGFRLDERWIME